MQWIGSMGGPNYCNVSNLMIVSILEHSNQYKCDFFTINACPHSALVKESTRCSSYTTAIHQAWLLSSTLSPFLPISLFQHVLVSPTLLCVSELWTFALECAEERPLPPPCVQMKTPLAYALAFAIINNAISFIHLRCLSEYFLFYDAIKLRALYT
jgi:hypothetical protein